MRLLHAACLTTCLLAQAIQAQDASQSSDAQAHTTPEIQPSSARPIRISGGVMAGMVQSKVDPVYPAEARAQHLSGTVVLIATISAAGIVENLRLVSGPQIFAGPAIDAVKQWVYRPYRLNGNPVEVVTTVTVNFNLNQ